MEQRQVDKIIRQIRNGINVNKNVNNLSCEISFLRVSAYNGKKLGTLEENVVKWLHREANYIDNELFHALNSFIEMSNPKYECD